MGNPVVELERVGVTLASVPVLVDVSFRVDPGSVIGIAGPNGAGKSTLLAVLATFLEPTTGTGTILGADIGTRQVDSIRPRIGWSGHDPGLYPELTLAENLRLWSDVAGLPANRAREALTQVGLGGAADRRASAASNGMQRRVDLARLLMTEPDLVLLDEAHAGLDDAAEEIIDEIVRRTRERGGGAVLVSHDAGRLAERTDRVDRIDEGTVK
jgi:heme exporter protein A